MSNSVGMRFNAAQLSRGMRAFAGDLPGRIDRALFRTGVEMLADFSNEAPKPPIDWGDLRGSAAVQVAGGSPIQNMVKGSRSGARKGKHVSKLTNPPQDELKPRTVRVSFNTEYAAHLHESPDWRPNEQAEQREPGQIGYKWMARKLEKHAAQYKETFAEFVKSELS